MYGLLLNPGKDRLDVLVCKDSILRAMSIWDEILTSIEKKGYKVRLGNAYPFRTVITVDGEDLCIRVREKIIRSEHVPNQAQPFRHLFTTTTWDYRPSGKLILTIDYLNCHNQTVNQITWNDTGKKRIEDRLISITEVMEKVANDLKRKRAWAEERDRIWKEEQRQREEVARQEALEEKRGEQLQQQASAWTLASSIRQFIEAVREEATRRGGAIDKESPLGRWLEWAERQADALDPVDDLITSLSFFKLQEEDERGPSSTCRNDQ